jgi:hypothetical protein
MKMRLLITLLALTALLACSDDPFGPEEQYVAISADGLVLTTDADSYASGAEVRLTLRNETDGMLGHNLCLSVLERSTVTGWVTVQRTPDPTCQAALALLEADGTATYTTVLPSGLPAGEYRFRTELEKMPTGERGWHVSNTFTVTD